MFKYTLILIYILLTFLLSIIFKKYFYNNKEVLRKIIHIGIGPLIPIALYLKIDQKSALIFTGIISLMVLLNYIYKLFPIIEDIDRKSFGTLFYCLSLFILIFIFWEKDYYSLIAGFFIMTFGDGLAGLVGKNIDSKSWVFLKQKKSFIGTFTMFITSLVIICSLGFAQKHNLNVNFFTLAFIATVLEQLSIFGIDNFIVPIVSAFYFNIFITNL